MFLPKKRDHEIWVGVLIAVPQPWDSQLSAVGLKLGDPTPHLVAPHVTLVPPIPVDQSLREEVIRHLRQVASGFRPFRVKLGSVRTFLPVSPVVYLELEEGADACSDLADAIRGGPLSYTPRFDYHPHVTIASGEAADVDEARKLIGPLDAEWTVQGFRLDRVDDTGAYSSAAIFDFAL